MSDVFAFLWKGNSWPGRLITLLLLWLLAAAARQALQHLNRYRRREMAALDDVRAKLRRTLDLQQEHTDPEGNPLPPALVDLQELRDGVPEGTLIADRLTALARMKQARVKVNVEALQQMTLLRESASPGLAFPGYAADLAMMLGMLGTFVGLCLMLLQMQGVLPGAADAANGSAFAQAAASMTSIITSKKTAFVTTLVGLACAIILSFLNFRLARAQAAFYDALERFTSHELLPATVPQVENEMAMERLSVQLSESFERLGSLNEDQGDRLERIEAMQAAFSTIVDSIRTVTAQAARAPAEETAGALTHVVAQLAATNDQLGRIARTVATAPRTPTPAGPWDTLRRVPPLGAAVALMVVAWIVFALWR